MKLSICSSNCQKDTHKLMHWLWFCLPLFRNWWVVPSFGWMGACHLHSLPKLSLILLSLRCVPGPLLGMLRRAVGMRVSFQLSVVNWPTFFMWFNVSVLLYYLLNRVNYSNNWNLCLTLNCLNFVFRSFLRCNSRWAPIVYRLIGAALIGIFFTIPSQFKIQILAMLT